MEKVINIQITSTQTHVYKLNNKLVDSNASHVNVNKHVFDLISFANAYGFRFLKCQLIVINSMMKI